MWWCAFVLSMLLQPVPDESAELQRRLRGGGVIELEPRVHHLARSLVVPSNTTLRGRTGTVLHFRLSDGEYGLVIAPNAHTVRIESLVLSGGGVGMYQGELYRAIEIVDCVITRPAGTPGVYASISNEHVRIERCRFHDIPNQGINLYWLNRSTIAGNVFEDVMQGMHLLNPKDDVVVSGNHGRRLHRMGVEVQQLDESAPRTRRLVVEKNVFTDWRRPFYDSFGLSVMPMRADEVRVSQNIVVATYEGPRGPVNDNGNLFGYGIELGYESGACEGNTVAGPFWYGIVVSLPEMMVRRNFLFGLKAGHEISGQVGGTAVSVHNRIQPTLQNLPPIPALPDNVPPAYRPQASRE